MTGMELYVKFMFTLTVGLVGVGLVMTTLLETLLSEWDPILELGRWWRVYSHSRHARSVRAEDILHVLEARSRGENERAPISTLDRRREDLRKLREAEERLASPAPV